ncbi:MAG: methionyl-tRNA formyltransferase [Steroidobacteraceae bacterium]
MRIVYLGTPQFAVPSLEALITAGHEVLTVVTQPDRPKGRGHAVAFSPVKECALRYGLPIFQPERIKRPEALAHLKALPADIMVVVGYGQILPQALIDSVALGIVNVHASLLPRLRGAAPIQWAIARGERITGVTTMRIDAGLDTGDMLLSADTAIKPEETSVELGERLSYMGAGLLVLTLAGLEDGSVQPEPQDNALATYAPIIRKEDGSIDWKRPAQSIHDLIRAMQPWPVAHTSFRGQSLRIWRSRVSSTATDLAPGTLVVDHGLFVAAGGGHLLEILELQAEGRKRLDSAAFLNGHQPAPHEMFGSN